MGVIYSILSFIWKQPKEVVILLCTRVWYEWQIKILSSKRALKLARGGSLFLYLSWLWSNFGWRRYKVLFLERGIFATCIQFLWVFFLIYIVSSLDLISCIGSYSSIIFSYFGEMELSQRGYFGYTVAVCCTLSWFVQLVLWSSSEWFRQLIKPYRTRILTVNLVVFILLMCLGAQVARAKFGIRVWYPNDRVYGERIGAAYWD